MAVGARLFPFWRLIPPSCPSGEQIANGSFETGDCISWTTDWCGVTQQYAHTGIYSVLCYESWLRQTFATPIPVSCVLSLTFYVESPWQGTGPAGYVTVHYADDTETTIIIYGFPDWHEYNITDQLESGKSIEYIQFRGGSMRPYWLDDVSLIGKG